MNTVTILLAATNVFTLAALIISLRKQGNNVIIDWSNIPGGKPIGLDPSFAKNLVTNYKNNQFGYVNNNPTWNNMVGNNLPGAIHQTDSRAVWFDLNTLKNFLYELETTTYQNCNTDVADSIKLGVRIYFGAYGDGSSISLTDLPIGADPMQYAYKHTLLLVPTYSDVNTPCNTDFDPNYFKNGVPVAMQALCGFTSVDSPVLVQQDLSTTNQKLMMLNHGSMVPPPFDPPSFSVTGSSLLDA